LAPPPRRGGARDGVKGGPVPKRKPREERGNRPERDRRVSHKTEEIKEVLRAKRIQGRVPRGTHFPGERKRTRGKGKNSEKEARRGSDEVPQKEKKKAEGFGTSCPHKRPPSAPGMRGRGGRTVQACENQEKKKQKKRRKQTTGGGPFARVVKVTAGIQPRLNTKIDCGRSRPLQAAAKKGPQIFPGALS